jgi:hypothetical protein
MTYYFSLFEIPQNTALLKEQVAWLRQVNFTDSEMYLLAKMFILEIPF